MEIVKPSLKTTKKIIDALMRGGVLVLPTDTVYGLVCDATNEKAVEKIYKIKKRPKNKLLPVFVKNIKMAKSLAFIDKKQEKMLNKRWPGKHTFILKKKIGKKLYGVDKDIPTASPSRIHDANEVGIGTIALRVPKYKFLNDLLRKINKPLAQTSANISGKPSLTKIKKVLEQFISQNIQPDIVIDAGDLPENKSSKIVDLTEGKEVVLRY